MRAILIKQSYQPWSLGLNKCVQHFAIGRPLAWLYGRLDGTKDNRT